MTSCPIDTRIIRPIRFVAGKCQMLDQRLLPAEEIWLDYDSDEAVAEAIRTMVVRGAPAIGIAAAIGAWFAARDIDTESSRVFLPNFSSAARILLPVAQRQ